MTPTRHGRRFRPRVRACAQPWESSARWWQETREEVVGKVRKVVPMVAGTIGAIVLLNVLRRRRG